MDKLESEISSAAELFNADVYLPLSVIWKTPLPCPHAGPGRLVIAGWNGSTAAEGFRASIILELMRPSVLEVELDINGVDGGDDAGCVLKTVKASEVVLHKLRLYLPERAAWKNPSPHPDTRPGRL